MRGIPSPLSENPAERSERSHFAVAATAPIDERATVAAECVAASLSRDHQAILDITV
jgi:hypothetical protein